MWIKFFQNAGILLLLVWFGCKNPADKENPALTGDPELDALTLEINKKPEDPKLYFLRGRKYYEKASYDNAINDLKKAIKLDSLNPEYYHLLADTYLDYYNSQEAIHTLQYLLILYPERIPTLLKLAEFKHIVEDYDGSILTVNEVVRLDPQNAEAYFMLGMNFRALGDTVRAINSFQTAVELDSGLTDAWMILGDLYESMEALHSKAFYLQNHGDIAGAKQIYRDIILKDKDYEGAYLNLGVLYMEQDSMDAAFEQFNILAGINPKNYMAYYMRGQVHEIKSRIQAAKADYESAHNLNSKDERVVKAIERLSKMEKQSK
jgi:tetratricopeptide (TPR) repeat protein